MNFGTYSPPKNSQDAKAQMNLAIVQNYAASVDQTTLAGSTQYQLLQAALSDNSQNGTPIVFALANAGVDVSRMNLQN